VNARSLATTTAAMLVCSLLAVACDQVGAPLVDTRGGDVLLPTVTCALPPACEPPDAGAPLALVEALAVDVRSCGGIGPDDSERCDPPREPDDDSSDAGVPPDADEDVGDISFDPNAPLLPPCESARVARMPAQLDCQDVTSRDAPPDVRDEEPLREASWHASNIRIESEVPRTIAIEQLAATDVWVELRGPVTLRIGGPGATPWISGEDGMAHFYAKDGAPIEGLRIAGVATAAGAPRLVLEGVRARSLVIGDEQRPFPGRVSVRTGDFFGAQLFARDLTLESTRVEEGRLRTELLATSDSVLVKVGIEAEQALLSATRLRESELMRCGELSLVECNLNATNVAACTGSPARFYNVRFVDAALDGVIEADGSSFGTTRFGTRAPTEIRLWYGRIAVSSLCAGVQALVLGEGAALKCSACEDERFAADSTCALPAVDVDLQTNFCPGLAPDAELAICMPPFPDRHRPDPNL
jgi:hypothetical protein